LLFLPKLAVFQVKNKRDQFRVTRSEQGGFVTLATTPAGRASSRQYLRVAQEYNLPSDEKRPG
jgi:hypothetical protein